jgi:DNA-binding XRE family transcriptional regulator
MTEEVKFIHGNDRINQLAQRPDIADGVTRVRAEMAEADRTYAMGLAALRQAADLTQAELACRPGVTQAAISRIEQPHYLLLYAFAQAAASPGGPAAWPGGGTAAPSRRSCPGTRCCGPRSRAC